MAVESNPTSDPYSEEYEDLMNDTKPRNESNLYKNSENSPTQNNWKIDNTSGQSGNQIEAIRLEKAQINSNLIGAKPKTSSNHMRPRIINGQYQPQPMNI